MPERRGIRPGGQVRHSGGVAGLGLPLVQSNQESWSYHQHCWWYDQKDRWCKMLEPLLGSDSSERALVFILARDQGYATEIARFFKTSLYSIQRQLDKLERGSVLVSMEAGRTRLYAFNPRYPFLP